MYTRVFLPKKHSKIFVALDPSVLYNTLFTISIAYNKQLQGYAQHLLDHDIVLLKELSQKDFLYMYTTTILPNTVTVYSQHPKGIDSRIIGKVPSRYIQGLYICMYCKE